MYFNNGNDYSSSRGGRGGRSQQPSYNNWQNSFSGSGANGGGYKSYNSGGGSGFYGGGFNTAKNNSWTSDELQPISKNNYKPVPSVQARNRAEVDRWLNDNAVSLDGEDVPWPVFEFSESTFPEMIVNLLLKNYQKPTPIQSISWPVALSGHDLISIAKTGSGKTLGFILPSIVHVLSQPTRNIRDGPAVIILLPTRELALQVEEVAQEYCKVMQVSLVCCYGGSSKGPQMGAMMRGVDICVATPGRLLDFMNSNIAKTKRCSLLILDEADRMLDMGFEPQIRQIAEQIRPDRQTLMFSATWPKDVRKLAADFHKNPVHLNVGSLDLAANHNILQTIECLEDHQKNNKLFEILDNILGEDEKTKTLIFVETKRKADDLTRWMRQDGWPALCIHGDKEQKEREWVLAEFKASRTPILIATDVAARGLDVDDVKFVINFDYPNNSEDYVHRIGRTGRREKSGTAITFFTSNNAPKARDLIKVLEEANQNVPARLADFANGTYYEQNGFRSRRGGGDFTGGNSYPVGGGGGGRGGYNNRGMESDFNGGGRGGRGSFSGARGGGANNRAGGSDFGVSSRGRGGGRGGGKVYGNDRSNDFNSGNGEGAATTDFNSGEQGGGGWGEQYDGGAW